MTNGCGETDRESAESLRRSSSSGMTCLMRSKIFSTRESESAEPLMRAALRQISDPREAMTAAGMV